MPPLLRNMRFLKIELKLRYRPHWQAAEMEIAVIEPDK